MNRPDSDRAAENELPPVFLAKLIRRGVVTTDPGKADECCGIERDDDGFCVYKPGHPIFIRVPS